MMTFANSLDPDQTQQNVGPDLDPNCWHSASIPERFFFFENDDLQRKSADDKKD